MVYVNLYSAIVANVSNALIGYGYRVDEYTYFCLKPLPTINLDGELVTNEK